jgi:hypothetical protein
MLPKTGRSEPTAFPGTLLIKKRVGHHGVRVGDRNLSKKAAVAKTTGATHTRQSARRNDIFLLLYVG